MKAKTKIKGPENLWNQHFSFILYLAGCNTMGSTLLYRCILSPILSMVPAGVIPFPVGLEHQPLCGKMSPFSLSILGNTSGNWTRGRHLTSLHGPLWFRGCTHTVMLFSAFIPSRVKKRPCSDPWWAERRTFAITSFSSLISKKVSFLNLNQIFETFYQRLSRVSLQKQAFLCRQREIYWARTSRPLSS